jgi:LTXXQ motif family protein
MMKRTIGAMTALFIASSAAGAQGVFSGAGTSQNGRLSQTEYQTLTDTRVSIAKFALQLTSEQQQYWPALEQAIRARAEVRYRRLTALEGQVAQPRDVDPVRIYRERATTLSERATGLKNLADAWQPLYTSLTPDQKIRMRLVAARVLSGLGAGSESRRVETYEQEEEDVEF